MEKLIDYLAVFDEEFENIFAISLVDKPANEYLFVNLSKDMLPVQLQVIDEEKRLVTGVVLVPNQKILRYDEKTQEYYNLVFTEEDIAKFSREFIKRGYQQNSTENHDYGKQIENLTFVETWIVEDPQKDKASALGFSVPRGTWMVTGYVENDDVLQKIKNKELRGFSIDGILKKVKVNPKNNTNMRLLDKLFALVKEEKQLDNLKEITTEAYGVITVEDLEIGFIVYDVDMNPLPDIEFEFEGNLYKTDDSGAIASIDPVTQEEEQVIDPPPTDTEDNLEGQLVEVVMENGDVFTSDSFSVGEALYLNGELYASQTTDIEGRRITTDEAGIIISNEEIIQEVEELKAQIATLQAEKLAALEELEALKASNLTELSSLQEQIDTLSKQPAAGKLKSNEGGTKLKESATEVFNRIAAAHKK